MVCIIQLKRVHITIPSDMGPGMWAHIPRDTRPRGSISLGIWVWGVQKYGEPISLLHKYLISIRPHGIINKYKKQLNKIDEGSRDGSTKEYTNKASRDKVHVTPLLAQALYTFLYCHPYFPHQFIQLFFMLVTVLFVALGASWIT